MIPPNYSSKTPAGERDTFNKLRDDPDTAGWVVLHSLDIKRHLSKIEGEMDMLILVPNQGVLCVEVKGCDVSRHEGKWIYPYEISLEGPFKQASKAMHSLRRYLIERDCSLSGILFFSAAIFTKVDFDEESPEWHSWQFINRQLFIRRPISFNVSNILNRAHEHVKSRTGKYSWYNENDSRPTECQVRSMVNLLRKDFEYAVSPRNEMKEMEESIQHFTEEQFDGLDYLQDNNRIVFKGPAGTGKTFLALEAARRAIAEGQSVLLICYNNLLGDWLKAQTSSLTDKGKLLWCGTLHRLLLDITGENPVEGANDEYWRKHLPTLAADSLLDDGRKWLLQDMLIIDEAQDLITEEYMDVFDLLLRGGLAGGRWALFGDFERQAIYLSNVGRDARHALESLAGRAPNHVNCALRINCRNAEPIAATLTITSGLSPSYKQVLHDFEGADVDPLFFSSAADQSMLLEKALCNLKKTFKAGEIVILSMRGDDASCARTASDNLAGIRLAPIRKVNDSQTIPFVSIHAFKGLEAAAVVITDIQSLDDERSRALLYVGMSRARIRLYMLMHESCRRSYDRILDSGLEKTSRR
jgi:hypothetical protein